MCCSKSRIKQAICISNIVLALWSLVVIALGVYVLKLQNLNLEIFGNDTLKCFAIGVIVSGCVLLLISLIGVCSVVMEKPCLVKAYIATHVILLAVFGICGAFLLLYRGNIKEAIKQEMDKKIQNNYSCDSNFTTVWNLKQTQDKCCGVYGETPGKIYLSSKWAGGVCKTKSEKGKVPMSCCTRDSEGKIIDLKGCEKADPIMKNAKHIYNIGCFDQMKGKLDYGITILATILIILAFTCLLGILFGILILRITFADPQFV